MAQGSMFNNQLWGGGGGGIPNMKLHNSHQDQFQALDFHTVHVKAALVINVHSPSSKIQLSSGWGQRLAGWSGRQRNGTLAAVLAREGSLTERKLWGLGSL